MKYSLLIAITCLSFFNCSENDNQDLNPINEMKDEETKVPIVDSISKSSANIGDLIIINGENFDSNETYIIKFNKIEGRIVEITSTQLKVEIPEKATSGEVTFTNNETSIIIGELLINNITSRLYANIVGNSQSIAEININDGSVISTIATLGNEFYNDIFFNESTNEIFGWAVSSGNIDPITGIGSTITSITKINVITGQINEFEVPNSYNGFAINKDGKLYANIVGNSQSIAEININDGSVISTIATLGNEFYNDIFFNESTNEIFGWAVSSGNIDPITGIGSTITSITKINVITGQISEFEVPNSYNSFAISNN